MFHVERSPNFKFATGVVTLVPEPGAVLVSVIVAGVMMRRRRVGE